MRNRKFKKQKRAKNKLTLESCFILIPLYVLTIMLLGVVALIICEYAPNDNREFWADLAYWVYIGGVLLSSAAMFFIGIPAVKKRQALRDLATYDFEAVPIGDEAFFASITADSEYIFKDSVFEADGKFTFSSLGEIMNYLGQFDRNSLIESRPLGKINDPSPPVAAPMGRYRAECKTEGERTVIIVYEGNSLTLKNGEIIVNGESYTEKLHAKVLGWFFKINAEMRVMLYAGDVAVCHVKFSRRIVDALEKYGICIDNPEFKDFVLANPRKAFLKLHRYWRKPME